MEKTTKLSFIKDKTFSVCLLEMVDAEAYFCLLLPSYSTLGILYLLFKTLGTTGISLSRRRRWAGEDPSISSNSKFKNYFISSSCSGESKLEPSWKIFGLIEQKVGVGKVKSRNFQVKMSLF